MGLDYVPLFAILLVGVVFISGCIQQTATPGTGQEQAQGPVKCTDADCFKPRFLECGPSEMKMPFLENTIYVITVFGVEDGKCHYASKVIDANGDVLGQVTDCMVPEESITEDTFGHLFGQDKAPGKEAVKAQQDKIEADYCTKE